MESKQGRAMLKAIENGVVRLSRADVEIKIIIILSNTIPIHMWRAFYTLFVDCVHYVVGGGW